MTGFKTLLKMNIKLLIRNKAFLIILIVLPMIAVLMLNLNDQTSFAAQDNSYTIHDLSNDSSRIFNMISMQLSVKVYDCSQSKTSEYLLQELTNTGSYQIYRFKSNPMDIATAREKALDSANRNVIGSVIYIPADFEEEILQGKESNAVVFVGTEDRRNELLKGNMASIQKSLYKYAAVTGYNKEELYSLLDTSAKSEITKNKVTVEVGDSMELTRQQQSSSSSIGYSLAFLSIAFLFSGVFIAATVVEERNNRVYNRILLSSSSLIYYGLVKLMLILMTVILETGIIAVAIKFLVAADFGIPYLSYLFLVFCLGLIFTLFSVVIGVLTNNVLTSNYIVFIVWSMTCVMAGLYFPLDSASNLWSRISMLMPQRWVVKTGEMLMVGRSEAYSTYILVVISYLFIISSIGFLGIKIRKKD
jgi:ABC-2 type transport system permease protein